MKKEALLYQKLKNQKVKCLVCPHNCSIAEGKRGICAVRQNFSGILYSLVYGKPISENIDPIEKKPLYHFLPKTKTLSVATVGCNLRCDNCQNWQISQISKLEKDAINLGEETSPEKLISDAKKYDCPSISFTYTEPTIFLEYALDCMKLAKQAGLKNIWVTNGYTSRQARKMIIPYLDAANVDLKFFDNKKYQKYCGAKLAPILETIINYKKHSVHLEITTLLIPEISDDPAMLKKIAQFIYQKLGAETPWHISRFFPEISYKMTGSGATPEEKIELAIRLGLKSGLKHVYPGNI